MVLKLKVLWFKNCLGLAIDQTSTNHQFQLTNYYFWPKTEAWEQLKIELSLKSWISVEEKIRILNLTSEVMNFWHRNRQMESFEMFQNQKYFKDILLVNCKS